MQPLALRRFQQCNSKLDLSGGFTPAECQSAAGSDVEGPILQHLVQYFRDGYRSSNNLQRSGWAKLRATPASSTSNAIIGVESRRMPTGANHLMRTVLTFLDALAAADTSLFRK